MVTVKYVCVVCVCVCGVCVCGVCVVCGWCVWCVCVVCVCADQIFGIRRIRGSGPTSYYVIPRAYTFWGYVEVRLS